MLWINVGDIDFTMDSTSFSLSSLFWRSNVFLTILLKGGCWSEDGFVEFESVFVASIFNPLYVVSIYVPVNLTVESIDNLFGFDDIW